MTDNQGAMMQGQAAAEKPKLVGVIDQLLRVLSDKVLDAETAIKENTTQLKLMASSVDLVRTIPQKMQAVEERLATSGSEMAKLRDRVDALDPVIWQTKDALKRLEGLIASFDEKLQRHAGLFEKPLHKSVHYRHFVGWPVFFIVVLCLLCTFSVSLCVQYYERADRYAASDIQWREALLLQDSSTLHELQRLKQNYAANPDSIRGVVIEEEERRAALAERLIEMNQKMQEIEELKRQRKTR